MEKVRRKNSRHYIDNMSIKNSFVFYALISLVIGIVIGLSLIHIYFTVNAIVGELDFPSSEIFYFQQQQFTFPVDTSMNVEIVGNKKALTRCV